MHVRDAPVGGIGHDAPARFHPIVITHALLASDGLNGYFPRALIGRLVVDLERYYLAGQIVEVGIGIGGRSNRSTIHGDQVVALLDLESGLSQGRARAFVPIFAAIDFGEFVVAIVGGEIDAE